MTNGVEMDRALLIEYAITAVAVIATIAVMALGWHRWMNS